MARDISARANAASPVRIASLDVSCGETMMWQGSLSPQCTDAHVFITCGYDGAILLSAECHAELPNAPPHHQSAQLAGTGA